MIGRTNIIKYMHVRIRLKIIKMNVKKKFRRKIRITNLLIYTVDPFKIEIFALLLLLDGAHTMHGFIKISNIFV